MELDEKLQALRTCAIRRLQQANEFAKFADEIELKRSQGASNEHLKAYVRVRADYLNTYLNYRFGTLDDDQNTILDSLRTLK